MQCLINKMLELLSPIAAACVKGFREGNQVVRDLRASAHAWPNYNAVLTLLWAYKVDPPPVRDDQEAFLEDLDPEEFTLKRRRWPR